jgi:hypothetical protein
MLLDLDYEFFSHFVINNGTRQTYHQDIKNLSTLLVTIGDSWTWGDSLCGIDANGILDHPDRLKLVYGYHLKNLIGDSDWINIGYPGTANRWIADVAERFVNLANKTNYKKIILSVGLTDIGRDIAQEKFSRNSIADQFVQYESKLLNQLQQISTHNNIQLIVGRNFTNTFLQNKDIIEHHLDKRWVDISAEQWKTNSNPDVCYSVKMPDSKYLTDEDKQWILANIVPGAEAMNNFLLECPLHYKIATKHPNELSHKLWAKYIFQYIDKNGIL